MFGVAVPIINSDVQGLVKDIGKDELDIRAPLPTHRCAYCMHTRAHYLVFIWANVVPLNQSVITKL